MMELVEDRSGTGELSKQGEGLGSVQYHIRRYQGMLPGSGLPVPGLHRIEGEIDLDPDRDSADWVGAALSLKLEDGRVMNITLTDGEGRILAEGHGPSKCQCC